MLPKVIIHTEVSVDGRMDWMLDDRFLYYRIIPDWKIDAMLSGSNTMLTAYPEPDTVESKSGQPPQKTPDLGFLPWRAAGLIQRLVEILPETTFRQ